MPEAAAQTLASTGLRPAEQLRDELEGEAGIMDVQLTGSQ